MRKLRTRVAVVDDDASVLRALTRFLRTVPFEVAAYGSGPDLIKHLKRFKPHCILLDLHMPEVGGLETQRLLARAKSKVPVIVITGHDSKRDRDAALKLGAGACFLKPIDGETLIEAINSLVESRRPARVHA